MLLFNSFEASKHSAIFPMSNLCLTLQGTWPHRSSFESLTVYTDSPPPPQPEPNPTLRLHSLYVPLSAGSSTVARFIIPFWAKLSILWSHRLHSPTLSTRPTYTLCKGSSKPASAQIHQPQIKTNMQPIKCQRKSSPYYCQRKIHPHPHPAPNTAAGSDGCTCRNVRVLAEQVSHEETARGVR